MTALAASVRRADSDLMMRDDRSRRRRLVLWRRVLLASAVMASVAVAAVLGYAVFLLAWGSSRDDPIAIPYFYLVVIVAGTPAGLACGMAGVGFIAVTRRGRRFPGSRNGAPASSRRSRRKARAYDSRT
jgi:hypothetical protein